MVRAAAVYAPRDSGSGPTDHLDGASVVTKQAPKYHSQIYFLVGTDRSNKTYYNHRCDESFDLADFNL